MSSTFEVLETSREQPYDPEVTIEPVPVHDPADTVWRLLTALLMVRKEEFPALAASFGSIPVRCTPSSNSTRGTAVDELARGRMEV